MKDTINKKIQQECKCHCHGKAEGECNMMCITICDHCHPVSEETQQCTCSTNRDKDGNKWILGRSTCPIHGTPPTTTPQVPTSMTVPKQGTKKNCVGYWYDKKDDTPLMERDNVWLYLRRLIGYTTARIEENEWSNQKKSDFISKQADMGRQYISSVLQKQREDLVEKVGEINLIEPCVPDCTPEQHAYHSGTWDSQMKLDLAIALLEENK